MSYENACGLYSAHVEELFADLCSSPVEIFWSGTDSLEYRGRSIEDNYTLILDCGDCPFWTLSVYTSDLELVYRSSHVSEQACIFDAAEQFLKVRRGCGGDLEYNYHGVWFDYDAE